MPATRGYSTRTTGSSSREGARGGHFDPKSFDAFPTVPRKKAARLPSGNFRVFSVPIMPLVGKTSRGTYDEDWGKAAVATQRVRARGHMHPALHINHHEDFKPDPEPAGVLVNWRLGTVAVEGKKFRAIVVDFDEVPEEAFNQMRAGRLPYISPEIAKGKPNIASVAIMPTASPFFKMPMIIPDKPTVSLRDDSVVLFAEGENWTKDDKSFFLFRTNLSVEEPKENYNMPGFPPQDQGGANKPPSNDSGGAGQESNENNAPPQDQQPHQDGGGNQMMMQVLMAIAQKLGVMMPGMGSPTAMPVATPFSDETDKVTGSEDDDVNEREFNSFKEGLEKKFSDFRDEMTNKLAEKEAKIVTLESELKKRDAKGAAATAMERFRNKNLLVTAEQFNEALESAGILEDPERIAKFAEVYEKGLAEAPPQPGRGVGPNDEQKTATQKARETFGEDDELKEFKDLPESQFKQAVIAKNDWEKNPRLGELFSGTKKEYIASAVNALSRQEAYEASRNGS